MFGFPGNLIVSTEVSRSIGETDDEKKYIMEQVLPPMLVGGLAGFAIALGITVVVLLKMLYKEITKNYPFERGEKYKSAL
jgi:hypothetical protein